MKHTPPGLIAITLIICLVGSANAQTAFRQSRSQTPAPVRQPAVVVISDRPLQNYATRRNGDFFTITIFGVGNFKTIGGGQPFEQQQPEGTNDLIISLQLLPGTNPQLEQAGTQLSIFFESVSLPVTGIPAGTFPKPLPPPRGQGSTGQVVVQTPPVSMPTPEEPIVEVQPLDADRFVDSSSSDTGVCEISEPGKDDPQDELVVIDANTGKILEGATRVADNTRVKVVFVNKNPFKYDYSFQLVPKDAGNTIIVSFLNLIPGMPTIPGILTGNITPATKQADAKQLAVDAAPGRQARIAGVAAATQCDTFADKLDIVVKNSVSIAESLKSAAKILNDAETANTNFLKATNDTYDNKGGRQERINFANGLCQKGLTALPALLKVVDFNFDKFSKELALDVFAANVTTIEHDLESAQCDPTRQALYAKVIGALKSDVVNFKTKLDELRTGVNDSKKKLESPTKIIKTAVGSSGPLRSSASFAEAVYAPSLGDATSVAITISRKNLRDEVPKDEVIAVSPPLQLGEPRVVLSGGIGFSSINERKIIRQQSLVPDGSGGMTLGNRFGFENRSQFRPSGVVMVNGILKRFNLFGANNSSFALSGGLVFSNRNDGLATEFIAGPSLGFANNKLFLTLGFHAARGEELSGGFKIGDPVPDNLADPLPVQKNWLNGLIMSLTFRIQP